MIFYKSCLSEWSIVLVGRGPTSRPNGRSGHAQLSSWSRQVLDRIISTSEPQATPCMLTWVCLYSFQQQLGALHNLLPESAILIDSRAVEKTFFFASTTRACAQECTSEKNAPLKNAPHTSSEKCTSLEKRTSLKKLHPYFFKYTSL